MKQFYSKDGEALVVSNVHIKINGKKAEEIEITDAQKKKLNDPELEVGIVDKKLAFTAIKKVESPEQIAKKELKAKLETGTATDTDIKEALKLLL